MTDPHRELIDAARDVLPPDVGVRWGVSAKVLDLALARAEKVPTAMEVVRRIGKAADIANYKEPTTMRAGAMLAELSRIEAELKGEG